MTWKHSLSPRPQRERSPCQLLLCGPWEGHGANAGEGRCVVSPPPRPPQSLPPHGRDDWAPAPLTLGAAGSDGRTEPGEGGAARLASACPVPPTRTHALCVPKGVHVTHPRVWNRGGAPSPFHLRRLQSRRPAPRGAAVRLRCWGPAVPRLPRGLSSAAAGPAVPPLQCPPPDSHPGAGRPTPALRGRWSPSSEPRVTSCLRAPWQVAPRGAWAPTSAWRPWARPFEGTLSLASGFPKAPCLSERPRPAVCLAQLCL